jgi:predicted ATPase
VIALKGDAALEVEAIYSRARALSQQTGETPQLVVALHNLGTFYNIRGQFQAARELGEQALQRGQEALALARELADPLNLTIALVFVSTVHKYRREAQRVLELSETAIEIARKQGFTFRLAMAMMRRGWALVEQGQGEIGIAQMRQGLADLRGIGDVSHIHYLVLAEAYAKEGHAEEGLKIMAEVLSDGWDPELYQLKGEILLRQVTPDAAQAEACFQQALDMAHCQHAKSIELRAATSLARLWQQQSKGDEARELLAPIYGWFTEGFDTADLQDAKTLLEELDR